MASHAARVEARENQRAIEENRRRFHVSLVKLLQGERTRSVAIGYARRAVRKWQRRGLCSNDFIQDWRHLLDGSIEDLIVLLGEQSGRANRLRQNSPFLCFLNRQKRRNNRP